MRVNPPIARLRERLRYEPLTGRLYWRHCASMPAWWNGKHAGREALTTRSGHGYRMGRIDGQNVLAHRVIWALVHGVWPEGEIDHEDHDRANNRLLNLRVTDDTGTVRNQSQRRDNTSGVTGVGHHAKSGKWRAYFAIKGRTIHLGLFDDFDDAVAARKAADIEHNFHANHGK